MSSTPDDKIPCWSAKGSAHKTPPKVPPAVTPTDSPKSVDSSGKIASWSAGPSPNKARSRRSKAKDSPSKSQIEAEEKLSETNADPKQLLYEAVRDGRIEFLRSLLRQLAKTHNVIEIIDEPLTVFDGSLLHYAVSLNSTEAVRALLSSGADFALQNKEGRTPIAICSSAAMQSVFFHEALQAISRSKANRLRQIIAAGVGIDSLDDPQNANTLLHYACSYSNDEVVRMLCESGANVNARNAQNDTPLHDAVAKELESVCQVLLEFGADPNIKNDGDESPADRAARRMPGLVNRFNEISNTEVFHEKPSVDLVEIESSSILPAQDVSSVPNAQNSASIECWTDLLWPQPQRIKVDSESGIAFPSDGCFKIYFSRSTDGEVKQIMQVLQAYMPYFHSIQLKVDYCGRKVNGSPVDGRLVCGIFEDGERLGAYTLDVSNEGINVMASDYSGLHNGFATLVQILKICRMSDGKLKLSPTLSVDSEEANMDNPNWPLERRPEPPSVIPYLSIRDYPNKVMRAVYQDLGGYDEILDGAGIIRLLNRISYSKANYFFAHFTVDPTKGYALPCSGRRLFLINQICDGLLVKLVPSLDLQSNNLGVPALRSIIHLFLDDFHSTRFVHFGPNISSILVQNLNVLDSIQKRIPRIFLSVENVQLSDTWINHLPSYVILCVDGESPFNMDEFISPAVNVVLKFSASNVIDSVEMVAKNTLRTVQICSASAAQGFMVCNYLDTNETMSPTVSLMPEFSCIGAAWNSTVNIARFVSLLPQIIETHFLFDGNGSNQ